MADGKVGTFTRVRGIDMTRTQGDPAVLSRGPAAIAAARVGRAGALLGALGLGSSLFVIFRLLETWRITPGATSHQVSIIGAKLTYPAANLAAVIVVALALLGLAVTAMMVSGVLRELAADRRLRRWRRRRGVAADRRRRREAARRR